jgi:mycofactocin system creatininase family protein
MPLLATARWPDLDNAPGVLVPIGSTEQHGPHLPLNTDSVIADAVAKRVGDELDLWVAAPISIGASGEHQGFPGVLSIGTTVLTAVIVELTRSLSLWAGEVVFINGHGGNITALTDAITQLQEEGHTVRWLPCATEGDAHAGYTETSLMLHLAPDSVDLERAAAGNTAPITELLPALRRDGVRAISPTGVLGDPTGASADAGARIFNQIVSAVIDAL